MTDQEKKKVRDSDCLLHVMKMVKETGSFWIHEDFTDIFNTLIDRRELNIEKEPVVEI